MQIRIESSFDSDVLQLVPDVGKGCLARHLGSTATEQRQSHTTPQILPLESSLNYYCIPLKIIQIFLLCCSCFKHKDCLACYGKVRRILKFSAYSSAITRPLTKLHRNLNMHKILNSPWLEKLMLNYSHKLNFLKRINMVHLSK